VEKGAAGDVIDAAKAGGAEGATVLCGRGSGIHEKAKFLGIVIEPEKEVVLTLVESTKRDAIFKSIAKGINIDQPGAGIMFSLDITRVIGINHLMLCEEDEG
jgi:nitrogen regulatory protein PII